MSRKLGRRLMVGGLAGLVLGTGPLLALIVLDPKSNPVGPGILAFLTFWPCIGCAVAGAIVWLLGRGGGVVNDEADRRDSLPLDRAA